jgi:hypothetical protein
MRIPLMLSLVVLAACGSDSTAPAMGSVSFKIDGVSCRGGDAIALYVDGSVVGTETLVAGGAASKAYPASAGQHLLGAKEVNSPFFVWPSSNAMVPSGGTFTQLLTCK